MKATADAGATKERVLAVVFAGGVGRRMHSSAIPKQFLELYGKPVIVRTLEIFENHPEVDSVAVACVEAWIDCLRELVDRFGLRKVRHIVPGGATGRLSIRAGLFAHMRAGEPPDALVMVHDGVRPLVGPDDLTRNLEAALHGRPLDCIILTHTHYDHCSGCVYCCERWPGAKVIAGTYAARVFSRPGALATIRRLNEIAARERGVPYPDPEKLLSLHVDETVSDGDVIDLGDLSFTVLETPGHTRCSIALYCPREAFLVSSETLGLFTGTPHLVMPCFLTGYAASVRSVRRVLPLPVTAILFPHLGLRRGEEIRGFFADALVCFEQTKDDVLAAYRAGRRGDDLIRVLSDRFYTEQTAAYQPRQAFLLNASYMIPLLVRECLGVTDFDMPHTVE